MRLTDRSVLFIAVIFLILTVVVSCSTTPDLKVIYRLPARSDELQGMKVALVFNDARGINDILGDGAKNEFKFFAGNISLSLARENEKGFLIGLLDIRSLCMEAFQRRLETLGVTVISEKGEGQIELVIVLKEFVLDLQNRRWVARIGYDGRIERSGEMLVKQTISGEAERLKIMGHSQADDVMSNLFTDVINRLDLVKMFRQASQKSP
ncbi:hypothetical protein ACFL0H_03745 [Thermodesulfobacteriota bacterium]